MHSLYHFTLNVLCIFLIWMSWFKELWKSCLVISLPCVLTLKSLSLILGFSLDLSLVTIKFWLLGLLVSDLTYTTCTKHLLNLDVLVWLFAFSCYTIHTSLKNDIYQCIQKQRWKKQSTHVLKKISVHVMIAFWMTWSINCQNVPKEEKKYDQKSPFWVGNSVSHSLILFIY
jgi:hypothetical protein